jgi:hypothetical protein
MAKPELEEAALKQAALKQALLEVPRPWASPGQN